MSARHRESKEGILGWFQSRMYPSKIPARSLIQENESASADIGNSVNISTKVHSQSMVDALAELGMTPVLALDLEHLDDAELEEIFLLIEEAKHVRSRARLYGQSVADKLYEESLARLISAIQDLDLTEPAQPPITSNESSTKEEKKEGQPDVHDGG